MLIYIREAHPGQGPKTLGDGLAGPGAVDQPLTIDDRVLAASACLAGLKLTLPMLIDSMDGVAMQAYNAWPGATAVVDLQGRLAFYSRGPRGVQPKEAAAVLKKLVAQLPQKSEEPSEETPAASEPQESPESANDGPPPPSQPPPVEVRPVRE